MRGVSIAMFFLFALMDTASTRVGAELASSHHDFGGQGWSGNEMCRPCHTPHGSDTAITDAPLWNHTLSSATYQLYSSSTLDAAPMQPLGASKLCLSCHDGTVALDSFGGQTGGTSITFGSIGLNLANHHPISMAYNSAVAATDGQLHDPSSAPSGLGGVIAEDLLFDGRLECSSCHDVHVARNTSGCNGCHDIHQPENSETLSLRITTTGSALCLTCHTK